MENDKCFCQNCEKFYPRSEMTHTVDCHGIPFRFVCYRCKEILEEANGYDGEYYTELDECIDDDY